MKKIKVQLITIIIACAIGFLLSLMAQRGGINPISAFISPLFGPWSNLFPPNSGWFYKTPIVTIIMSILFGGTFLYLKLQSSIIKNFLYIINIVFVIFWSLTGIMRVLLDLT